MKRTIGAVVLLVSLACIISVFIEVVTGKAGLWSPKALGGYLFHFVTMLVALVLIAGKPKQAAAQEEDA